MVTSQRYLPVPVRVSPAWLPWLLGDSREGLAILGQLGAEDLSAIQRAVASLAEATSARSEADERAAGEIVDVVRRHLAVAQGRIVVTGDHEAAVPTVLFVEDDVTLKLSLDHDHVRCHHVATTAVGAQLSAAVLDGHDWRLAAWTGEVALARLVVGEGARFELARGPASSTRRLQGHEIEASCSELLHLALAGGG